jgi:hypothetical protein
MVLKIKLGTVSVPVGDGKVSMVEATADGILFISISCISYEQYGSKASYRLKLCSFSLL